MTSGYNANGRPQVEIQQRQGGPWAGKVFDVKAPDRQPYTGLDRYDVVAVLSSYPIKPDLKLSSNVTGKARTFFRSAISGMPLPEALQEA